jgi:tRNA threonylcarbamoyladenosine biosynthesis protein TsaB
MVGLSSLDLLAFALHHTEGLIATVVDARRGEVFAALYRPVPGGVQRVAEPRVCAPGELASELMAMGENCLLVGDGAMRYASSFDDARHLAIADGAFAHPSPAALVQLAHARALREEFVNSWDLQPVYLRKADAEANWEKR